MAQKFEDSKLEIVWKLVLGVWDLAFLHQPHLVERLSRRDHRIDILLGVHDEVDDHRFVNRKGLFQGGVVKGFAPLQLLIRRGAIACEVDDGVPFLRV